MRLTQRILGCGLLFAFSILFLGILSGCSNSTSLPPAKSALVAIQITANSPAIAMGTSEKFTATGIYQDSSTQDISSSVNWESSDTNVALISNDSNTQGSATALSVGTVTIKATDPVTKIMSATTLTVTSAVLTQLDITPTDPTIAKNMTEQFTATGIFSDSTTQDMTATVDWSSADDAVATVSNDVTTKGQANGLTMGSVVITAMDSASGISATTTLNVTDATLVSIAITPNNPSVALGAAQQFTATGTFSDSNTYDITTSVTWASSDAAIATIGDGSADKGLAHSMGEGSATITATDSASGISGTTSLSVTAATLDSIEIAPANLTIGVGTTQQFTATGHYSDSTTQDITTSVTWSSSDANVASISNASGTIGLANAVAPGTATIMATDPVSGVSSDTLLTVSDATLTSIQIEPVNPSIVLGSTQQFKATGLYSDSTTQDITALVTWSSSDTAIATISNDANSKGQADTVAAGAVTITATDPASTISSDTTLTVTAATLVSIDVTPTDPSIAAGAAQQFMATGHYSDNTTQDITTSVTWSSSDTALATISNTSGTIGLATAVAAGTVTITATDPASTISSTTMLTVTAATLTSIDVTPTDPSIALGSTQQFTATGHYSDNTTQDITASVTWSSSDTAVATISNTSGSIGLATGVAAGTVTITASDPTSTISSTTMLTVTAATLTSIDVTPTNPSIVLGSTQQFTATGHYSDNTTQDITTSVTWSSSDTAVATISNASGTIGLADSVAPGTVTITATDAASTISSSTMLTITAATLTSIDITPADPSIALGTTQQFTATGHYSDNTTQDITTSVTWSSSDTAVATISNVSGTIGLADSVAPGTVTITATDTASTISSSTMLTVTAAALISIDITPADPSIALGTTQQFTATGHYSDNTTQDITTSVTWSSSDTTVATISNTSGTIGLATAVAAGTVTITATDSASTVSSSTTLTVTTPTLMSIQITPASATILVGATLQYTATGTYSDGSTQDLTTLVTWHSSNNQIASVSNAAASRGLATGVRVGNVTISAIDSATNINATAALAVVFMMPQ